MDIKERFNGVLDRVGSAIMPLPQDALENVQEQIYGVEADPIPQIPRVDDPRIDDKSADIETLFHRLRDLDGVHEDLGETNSSLEHHEGWFFKESDTAIGGVQKAHELLKQRNNEFDKTIEHTIAVHVPEHTQETKEITATLKKFEALHGQLSLWTALTAKEIYDNRTGTELLIEEGNRLKSLERSLKATLGNIETNHRAASDILSDLIEVLDEANRAHMRAVKLVDSIAPNFIDDDAQQLQELAWAAYEQNPTDENRDEALRFGEICGQAQYKVPTPTIDTQLRVTRATEDVKEQNMVIEHLEQQAAKQRGAIQHTGEKRRDTKYAMLTIDEHVEELMAEAQKIHDFYESQLKQGLYHVLARAAISELNGQQLIDYLGELEQEIRARANRPIPKFKKTDEPERSPAIYPENTLLNTMQELTAGVTDSQNELRDVKAHLLQIFYPEQPRNGLLQVITNKLTTK